MSSLNNMGKIETFQPMYYYEGEPLLSKHLVKHMFDKIKAANDTLIVEFKNDPLSSKLKVDKTFENFVLMKKRIVMEGNDQYTPVTISYSDVISQEVHISGKGGKLKPWIMSVPVPEQPMLKALKNN